MPVVAGVPVQGNAVPMGRAVDEDAVQALRASFAQESRRAEDSFKLALSIAGQHELDRLNAVGLAAQRRLASSADIEVAAAVRRRLQPALADFLSSSTSVAALTRDVERRVYDSAHGVVRRLASEQVAEHALNEAIERRCLAHINERLRGVLWGSAALGALAGAASAAAVWFGWGPPRR